MSSVDNSLDALAERAYNTAVAHGFHEYIPNYHGDVRDVRHILSLLMLVTTEVAEAAEAVRNGLQLEQFAAELADIIIRTIDCAEALGLDIEGAVLSKMKKNADRSFRHGGKRA